MSSFNLSKMFIVLSSVGLISCSNTENLEPDFQFLLANEPNWVEVKNESTYSDVIITEYMDISTLSKWDYKEPLIVRTKTSYRTIGGISTEDRDEIIYSLVECFNSRSATVSYEDVLMIPNSEPIIHSNRYLIPDYNFDLPDEIWQQIPKDTSISTYCSKLNKTNRLDNFVNKTQEKLGWIPIRIENSPRYHYLNINNLDKISNFVPFKLEVKVYKVEEYLDKTYTSTTYSVIFDCKNHRMAIWNETLNMNDFEYKPNPNPTVLEKYNYFKELSEIDDWELIDTDSFVYKEKICQK